MSSFPTRLGRQRPTPSDFAAAVSIAAGCVATAGALGTLGPGPALALALLPIAMLIAASPRAVLWGVVGALAATIVLGRDFAYLRIGGGPYILDVTLLVALTVVAPSGARALARRPLVMVAVLGIVLVSGAHLVLAGIREETLRQSVLGFYVLWSVIGLVIAETSLVRRFASVVYVAALFTTALYAIFQLAPDNVLTATVTPRFINAAGSLYVGYALLLVIFARPYVPKFVGPLAVAAVAAVQLAEIGGGAVRSIWVALPAAIVATVALGGIDAPLARRLSRAALPVALLAVTIPFFFPATASRIASEAASIVGIRTGTSTDANRTWRLSAWGEAINDATAEPLTGLGVGRATVIDADAAAAEREADAHNSFVAFGFRYGLAGLLLLALFEIAVLRAGRKVLRSTARVHQWDLVRWLLAAHLLTAFHAVFTVVLEGPYMGTFYWLFGGLVLGLAQMSSASEPAR